MLVFFENAWHVFAAVLVLLLGLIIALIQKKIFGVPQKRAIILYFWHTFFCIFYFWYSVNNAADAKTYYFNSLTYDGGLNFGSLGVYYVTSFFTQVLNMSYGNVFLVFNIFGFVGLIALASALQHVTRNSRSDIQRLSILFLFLPGLSFWSVAIGKDAFTFMGAGLATWAALDFQRRLSALAISLVLYLIPRPHMAGILLLSFSFALLLSSRLGLYKKLSLLIILVPLTIVGIQLGMNHAGLESVTDLAEIEEYFDGRQQVNLGGGSSVDIASMPLLAKLLTYLLRPLFFDATGILGLIVSFENFVLLALCLAVALRRKRTPSNLGRFEFSFYILFVGISWLVLSSSTANLGIAVRQKIMFLPMLVVVLFSVWQGRSSTKLS